MCGKYFCIFTLITIQAIIVCLVICCFWWLIELIQSKIWTDVTGSLSYERTVKSQSKTTSARNKIQTFSLSLLLITVRKSLFHPLCGLIIWKLWERDEEAFEAQSCIRMRNCAGRDMFDARPRIRHCCILVGNLNWKHSCEGREIMLSGEDDIISYEHLHVGKSDLKERLDIWCKVLVLLQKMFCFVLCVPLNMRSGVSFIFF